MTGVLNAPALFGIGLFLLLWLALALWAILRGIAMQRRASVATGATSRLASLVEASPQIPVILRGDWRLEASGRLGTWLGLSAPPASFDELKGTDEGLDARAHETLRQAVIGAQRGSKPFSLVLRPMGGSRELLVQGMAAPPAVGGPGSVLLWISDTTETQAVLSTMRRERDDARHGRILRAAELLDERLIDRRTANLEALEVGWRAHDAVGRQHARHARDRA